MIIELINAFVYENFPIIYIICNIIGLVLLTSLFAYYNLPPKETCFAIFSYLVMCPIISFFITLINAWITIYTSSFIYTITFILCLILLNIVIRKRKKHE